MSRPTHGFALVSAVFMVALLSLLAGAMVSLSMTQQLSSVRDVFGTRAYYVARAGIEWGTYQVLQAGACAASSTLPALGGSAKDFTLTVTCSVAGPYDEAGTSVRVYTITSTASIGAAGAPDRAERQLQAVVAAP